VVAAIRGSATAGDYVAAYNVVMLAAIAGAALHAAVLPRLLDEYRQGEAPRWPGRAAIVSALALPFMVLLGLFSSSIMTTLYGQTYSSAGSILRVLSPLAVLYIVNPFLASSLIAAGHQRALSQIAVLNAVVAVVSYPLATSSFGARGAAAASVGAEILSTVLVVRALRRPAAAPDAADAFGGVVS
jgi:O-antigen/teichoic acid export membrane protein